MGTERGWLHMCLYNVSLLATERWDGIGRSIYVFKLGE